MHTFTNGYIILFAGCMFSSKTESLQSELRRHELTHKVVLFKVKMDTRYSVDAVVSHNHSSFPSITVESTMDIDRWLEDNEVAMFGIDEAQFLKTSPDLSLVDLTQKWANLGKMVVVTALDQDFRGRPFPGIPELWVVADQSYKLNAVCKRCKGLATHSYRKVSGEAQVLVGGSEAYEALCRACFNEAMDERL